MAGRISRACKWLGLLLALAAVAVLALAWWGGAWHLLFPSRDHDRSPPTLPTLEAPALLVFSKTNGFRHREGIEGGRRALAAIAERRGWGFYTSENGALFNDRDLSRFAGVVFLNATGDMLSEPQQLAFQRWLEQGGGWLGVHAAGDGSQADWDWYMAQLIGARFTAHILDPQFQTATVLTEHPEHPVNAGLPAVWDHEEEWYSWADSPRERGFTILATLDEDSYTPVRKLFNRETDLRMGDHPVVWSNCVGRGRAVYAAMGHRAAAFAQPTYRRLLENALAWLLGLSPGGCPASRPPAG